MKFFLFYSFGIDKGHTCGLCSFVTREDAEQEKQRFLKYYPLDANENDFEIVKGEIA